MNDNDVGKHCIRVSDVYDMADKQTHITLRQKLKIGNDVTDHLCGNIFISCGQEMEIWRENGSLLVSGCVTVTHMTGCKRMEVFINKTSRFMLEKGETKTIDLNQLRSLAVQCHGTGNLTCTGKYCLDISYGMNQGCLAFDDVELLCFLSDEHGNPSENVQCQEISQPHGRPCIEIVHPNGKSENMQKVMIEKQGFITVKMIKTGDIITIYTLPFKVIESLFLHAPIDTFSQCRITAYKCKAYLTKECQELLIDIDFTQEIKVIKKKNINITASTCIPRSPILGKLYHRHKF